MYFEFDEFSNELIEADMIVISIFGMKYLRIKYSEMLDRLKFLYLD